MSEFDPFDESNIDGGGDNDGMYFGEFFVYRGFQGIWVFNDALGKKQLEDYDPNNDAHKTLIASGKKPYTYYEVQFFPLGVSFETWVENLANFSDEWAAIRKSLCDVLGVGSRELGDWLRDRTNQPIAASWKSEVVEQKDKDGVDRKKYLKHIQALYGSLDEAQAAHDAHKGIGGNGSQMPENASVKPLERSQAIGWIKELAKQIEGEVTPEKLLAEINNSPMLGKWRVDDPDLLAIVEEIKGVPF